MMKILKGAAYVVVSGAIGKGTIVFLAWKGLDLPLMVATMLDGLITSGAAGWFIVAFFAAAGLVCFELHQRRIGAPKAVTHAHSAATPDLPASGSNAIKGIASGDSWKKLNALLHSGEIMAWSRTEGYKNLRPIRPERWFNGSLEFLPSGDSFVADPGDLRPRPWKKGASPKINGRDYDIHFNRAQLKKHWPDLF